MSKTRLSKTELLPLNNLKLPHGDCPARLHLVSSMEINTEEHLRMDHFCPPQQSNYLEDPFHNFRLELIATKEIYPSKCKLCVHFFTRPVDSALLNLL
jgi:hypothetical protein